MGVLQLWSILEPVKRTGDLSLLNGKTLCVDLSVWICEAHGAKGLKTNVLKPHLRNLFFRIWNLIRAGVKLVFVADGDPPKVKWEAILRRTQARNGFSAGRGKDARGPPRKKVGRSNFRVWVNECIALLKLLGVPYVESAGEAEALCAWMNAKGFVDGCITNDGDVFLYGGKTVYKGLCISTKECMVDCYSMDDVEAQLGLSRNSLIGLAILLGCDYLPQGVPGVGKEMGLKLINALNGFDLLERFNQWSTFQITDADMSKIERSIKQKALKIPGFPNREVISEFLSPKLKTQHLKIPQGYNCPDVKGMQEFCLKYLEWPEDYTSEKVLPLVTYWQMDRPLKERKNIVIIPERIVKPRIQNRIECYEVLWRNENISDTSQSTFTTIENKQMFDKVYPGIIQDFEVARLEKKSTRKQGKGKNKKTSEEATNEDNLDYLCENLGNLSLVNPTMVAKQDVNTNGEGDTSCHQEGTRGMSSNRASQVAKEDVFVDEEINNISDSLEIPLPLSERLALKKRTIGEVDECKVDGNKCYEIDVLDEACKVSSDSFEVPLPLSERIALKTSTSGKVKKCEVDGKRNKEINGMTDSVHKSLNRNVPMCSKENKSVQHSSKSENKLTNAKRKQNILHCVEFSSSESDGEDSWFDDPIKESCSKVLSSTSKTLSKENISGLTKKVDSLNVNRKFNVRNNKGSQSVLKDSLEVQKLKQGLAYDKPSSTSRKSALSSSVDVNLVSNRGEETGERFDGSSSNPEENRVVLLTPEISRIKDKLPKMLSNYGSHNPVSKPVKQELQVKEVKPENSFDEDVFLDENDIVLITPEKHGNPAGKIIQNDTKSCKNSVSATCINNSLINDKKGDEEKENNVESPLFVPLPLSERIRILRESQTQ